MQDALWHSNFKRFQMFSWIFRSGEQKISGIKVHNSSHANVRRIWSISAFDQMLCTFGKCATFGKMHNAFCTLLQSARVEIIFFSKIMRFIHTTSYILYYCAVWSSGNALASINAVALCQTQLVPG